MATAVEQPFFSIIVPVYNLADHIEKTIESVQRQALTDWEMIVVDDGSSDNSLELVNSIDDPRIRCITQENQGSSSARNTGLAQAQGAAVIFLDGDDCFLPDTLQRFHAALAKYPDVVAVYGEARTIDSDGQIINPKGRPWLNRRPSGYVFDTLVERNFVLLGAICIRRATLKTMEGFHEGLRVAEDWEYWCRLALKGPFQYLGPTPLMEYRIHPKSITRTQGVSLKHVRLSVEAVFSNPDVQDRLGKRATRLKRRAISSMFSFVANQHLRTRNWGTARQYLTAALLRKPHRAREWFLLICALFHWLPDWVERRIK